MSNDLVTRMSRRGSAASAAGRPRIGNPDEIQRLNPGRGRTFLLLPMREHDEKGADHQRMYGDRHRQRGGEMPRLAVH
jgi:hypothetical protein